MTKVLTSWKEIAHHLGKGVRTVQRWEHEGLPVRRPAGGRKHRVLAYPKELDAWLRNAYSSNGDHHASDSAELRAEIDKLLVENQLLQRDLNALLGMSPVFDYDARGSLLYRCSKALEESAALRRRCSELRQGHVVARAKLVLKPWMP